MILRGSLLEQAARRDIVLRSADAIREHEAELILRFRGILLRRSHQHGSGLCGIAGSATRLGDRREIGDAARVAALGGALEQLARLRLILGNARSGAEHDTEL